MTKIPRIIPCLLLKGDGLVKGRGFKNHIYIGDPVNAVRIFNDKEVDELIFLDITATQEKRCPNIKLIQDIADECYMPFAVGGGIKSIEDIRKILNAGAEKVVINTSAVEIPSLIEKASSIFGSQSIIVSIDVKKNWIAGERVFTHSGKKKTSLNPERWAKAVEELGAGEIIITSIEYEGRMEGYNLEMIKRISSIVNIPVIASGGAGKIKDFESTVQKGASAVAVGSMFIFKGRHRAVLINYPSEKEINIAFNGK